MEDLKKITMTIKRTQYIEVEVSAEEGFDMPKGLLETVEFIQEFKEYPERYIDLRDKIAPEYEHELVSFEVN